jgi:exonuclease III
VIRIVFWNIMAGGGKRANAIVAQLMAWNPTIVALAEFRATPPSQSIAHQLSQYGLSHQLTTAEPTSRARNALLLASRYPLQLMEHQSSPDPAHRWLLASVQAPAPVSIGVMHIPNMHTGLKTPYHNAVLSLVDIWQQGAGLLIGDTNSGIPDIDEESPAFTHQEASFMQGMERAGWHDAFRMLHGQQRAYTWYSPNGKNGFRLDQAFVNTDLIQQVQAFRYVWGQAAGFRQLSDHAAIVLDIK